MTAPSTSPAAAGALVRATLAAALALLLLAGPPIVLIRFVGNPFPTVIPSWDDLSYAVTNGQIDAWTWVKALALVGWVAWANLVAGFAVELSAAARGVKAKAVRGLGATQWFASRIVAQCSLAATVLFQSTVGVTAVGGLPPLPLVSAPFSASVGSELDPDAQPTEAPSSRLLVDVGRRDTLWGLAETHLGDGERWVAIRDANIGRTMSDGSVLSPDFTRVSAGWTLVIPDDAPAAATGPSPHLARGSIEIEPGDNLWRLSRSRLEAVGDHTDDADVLAYVGSVVADNAGLIDDPDLIYPGQVFTFPEVGEPPVPAGLSKAAQAGSAPTTTPAITAPVAERRHDRPGGEQPPSADAVGGRGAEPGADGGPSSGLEGPLERLALVGIGAAGALMAAGARRTLLRRRRYALAHRTPGTVPRPPRPELEQIERALHRRADEAAVRWLEAAMGSLATRPIWAGEHVAQPVGVTWRQDQLDVEFTAPDPMAAPLPWITHDGGRHWLLSRETAIKDLPTAGPDDPVPTLITVGLGRLVNLEGLGVLSVAGSGGLPMDLVRSIVHELATSTSAGTIDIRTTLSIDGTQAYDLVRGQSPSSLNDELVPWLEGLAPRLDKALSTNAFAYRIVSQDEPMFPVVVVTDAAGIAAMATLTSLARLRTLPIAIVVVGAVDAEFSVELTADAGFLHPWGERIEPQLLNAAAAAQLGELLLAAVSSQEDPLVAGLQLSAPVVPVHRQPASDDSVGAEPAPITPEPERDRRLAGDEGDEGHGPTMPPDLLRSVPAPVDRSTTAPPSEEAGERSTDPGDEADAVGEADPGDDPTVVVRVLGDIEVVGVETELTSQQLSILTYLACHGPSSRASIIEALWDGQVISRSRFPNLLAELRARLGRHHLPEAQDARYRLRGVTTDLVEFERQVGVANKQPLEDAAITLRLAMDLVRGVPLTPPGRRFWSWIGDETYLAARIEALVADSAARLARVEQDLGNLVGAQQACEQGLLASPTDETLIVVLTEVYMMQGKPGLARRLVERWEDKIGRLECGEPSDEPRKRLAG